MAGPTADNIAVCEAPTAKAASWRGRSVLIVDDESSWLADAARALTAAGYHVLTATTGQQAMTLLRKVSFDVLILDQEMPNLPGLELLKFIRTNSPWQDVPVLMLTSASAGEVIAKGGRHGVRDVIEKSHFALAELVSRLGGILGLDPNVDATAA